MDQKVRCGRRVQEMNKQARRLCEEAEMLSIGAERAAKAGDMVAFCHLSIAAQERVLLAKQMKIRMDYDG